MFRIGKDSALDKVLASFPFSLPPNQPISSANGICQERIHWSEWVLVLHRSRTPNVKWESRLTYLYVGVRIKLAFKSLTMAVQEKLCYSTASSFP